MGKTGFDLVVKKNGLSRLPAALRRNAQTGINRTALEIERAARLNTERVEYGPMRAGWYTVTPDDSGYEEALGEAKRLNPKAPTLEPVSLAGEELCAAIGNTMAYTEHHEVGTTTIPAAPMLEPAVEAHRDVFNRRMGDAVDESAREVSK